MIKSCTAFVKFTEKLNLSTKPTFWTFFSSITEKPPEIENVAKFGLNEIKTKTWPITEMVISYEVKIVF